jgi:shikimate dehydrogenase
VSTDSHAQARAPQAFAFIGVTASASSINRVFPRWARILDLEHVRFEPLDLPLDSHVESYRRVVQAIRDDAAHRGALVTTHKVRLLHAGRDLFDAFDQYAEACDEVSCISKRDGRLIGHAKDPITSGRALEDLLPPDHFRATGGEVVCLGAGGAGLAIAVYLATRRPHADRPGRVTLVDRDGERLRWCRSALDAFADVDCALEFVATTDPTHTDEVIAAAAPGTLIINATGMGKDRPGSPVGGAVLFPEHSVVWDLNYRGELEFLQQARAQAATRSLTVEDGWRYFIHGWSEVIAEVFDVELTPRILRELSDEAAGVRS